MVYSHEFLEFIALFVSLITRVRRVILVSSILIVVVKIDVFVGNVLLKWR